MHRRNTHIALFISFPLFVGACSHSQKESKVSEDSQVIPDTIHAVTLYGPTSYFNYRGQEMGFDYENLKRFAEDEGYVLDLKIAPSLQVLLKMLSSGKAELAAYPIPKIEEYNNIVIHCGPKEVTWQVLVQPAGKKSVTDVTQLVGKTVYVEKDSKYHYRMTNLNNELGGGIDIVPISKDTLIAEDLIRMVDNGEIPMTIVDSDIAKLNKSYYPNLDVDMKVSLDQYSSWAVGKGCDSLAYKLDVWGKSLKTTDMLKTVYKKYFEISKSAQFYEKGDAMLDLHLGKGGRISSYDEVFKRHASLSGFDWILLAAIAYNESRFNNDVVSWAGAKGVMQLMPSTARAMGIASEEITIPERNIYAAAKLLKNLDRSLEKRVPDKKERLNFVIAAYNSGLGHIFDAIALADKHGLDPAVWLGNVSEAALMKSRPAFYNDPVVKNGYFRGRETIDFVDNVNETYSFFKNAIE